MCAQKLCVSAQEGRMPWLAAGAFSHGMRCAWAFAMPVHSTCFPEASPVGIPWRGLGQIVFQSAAGQQIVYGFSAARFEKWMQGWHAAPCEFKASWITIHGCGMSQACPQNWPLQGMPKKRTSNLQRRQPRVHEPNGTCFNYIGKTRSFHTLFEKVLVSKVIP